MNAKLVLFAAVVMIAPPPALADPGAETHACTPERVVGTYGLVANGTVLPGNAAGLPSGPLIATGLLVFDANGQIHGSETISFNGTVVGGIQYGGTYTVNPDCTITLEDPGFFHNFGVIVANGSELMLMSTDNGMVLSITAKRIDQK